MLFESMHFFKAGYASGLYHPFFDITGLLTEVNSYLEQ